MTFEDYCTNKDIDLSPFSKPFLNYVSNVYNQFHISLAPFLSAKASEYTIQLRINDEIRKLYKMQFHNIGEGVFEVYYKFESHYSWLKLEHLLIQLVTNFAHNYSKNKSKRKAKNPLSQIVASNKYLAIRLGWLSENETDSEVITKACRKVTDNLAILKNDRKTISVEQKYVHGKQGSYHLITLNWLKVIDYYTNYDPKMDGSIRLRKSIKYRVISFIRKTTNKFSDKLTSLMRSQRLSYLVNLVSFNIDDFQNDKYVLYKILNSKWIGISKDILNTKNIIPVYSSDCSQLTLNCKTDLAYNSLNNNADYLNRYFSSKLNIKLSIVAS